MMDGGANICITGLLGLLVDVKPTLPLPISVATKTAKFSLDSCCTKKGLLPLTLDDGSIYYQPCHYCKNAIETIISPDAILQSSNILVHWHQEGHRHGGPGKIRFSSDSGLYAINLSLEKCEGLYYCPTDVFTVTQDPTCPGVPSINRIAAPSIPVPPTEKRGRWYYPAESETWMLRLGSPGEEQLDLLPGNVTGVPPGFLHHPFCFIDWKEEEASRNKLLNGLPNVPPRQSNGSTWILVSCAPPLQISLVPTRKLITLLPHMIDSLCTS